MESLKESLRKAIERNNSSKGLQKQDNAVSNKEEDPDVLFEKEFRKVNLGLADIDQGDICKDQSKDISTNSVKCPLNIVPPFYVGLPPENDDLRQKLREEARAQFLQRRSKALLDNEELKALYSLLENNASASKALYGDGNAGGSNLSSLETNVPGSNNSPDEYLLNYEEYKRVSKLAGDKCQPYFTAKIFAKLQNGDPHGRISVMAFFNYVMRKVWLHQTRIGLSLYDVTGQGFLREQDMENYIAELIETLPQLDGLDKSFHSFYVCTAVRKFFFFLDPMRTGKIRIADILACSFLDDLLELRDQDLAKDIQEANWFSAPSALRVYGQYLNLDKDHNGMLSRSELLAYGTGTLTSAFVDRVFQECLTYGGEMDYKTYLDFVLALENRREPQALTYFFRILDVRQEGSLNTFVFNYFFRDILKQMEKLNQVYPYKQIKILRVYIRSICFLRGSR